MSNRQTGRLLVVDDETSLMAALRNTLREEGYKVTAVASGAEGLEALRREEFDLVLTDLVMPKMDGIALLKSAFEIDPRLVAVIMTGHGSIPTAVEAMRTGAIDYVLKPIKLRALLPALERALTVQRLRKENAELGKQVRDHAARLEAANRDLEAFSTSVAHDLRTPLRTISGFIEIIRSHHQRALPPEVRRYLELIDVGAEEMDGLISGLLAFSRFGQQALTRETVDLALLCRDIFKALESESAGRRVDLRFQPLPKVRADPALLRQALSNLISNALKFTRTRDPAVIEVGCAPAEADAAPVYFVRDNGVGFDMRDAGRLFGVFQRLHPAHEFEGTGVGLATARRIIERHGGRIWAEAVPDSGATFFFTVPSESERMTATGR
jgi:signal transduction histidine kinase